jgi:exosome complex protein LRP1
MTELTEIIVELESCLIPLYELRAREKQATMDPMDHAKINMAIAYVVQSLLYMYLKAAGIEPSKHPFHEEINRVKAYTKKLKDKQTQIDILTAGHFTERMQEAVDEEEAMLHSVEPLNSNTLKPDASYLQNISNSSDNEEKKRKRSVMETKPKKKKI